LFVTEVLNVSGVNWYVFYVLQLELITHGER
jgi:hypothetical protein